MADKAWKKLIYNAIFEQKFMQYYYKTFIRNVFDAMLAEQVITSEKFPRGLAYVAEKYTGIILNKDQQKSFIDMKPVEMFTPEQLEYASKDVEILFPIYDAQAKIIKEDGLERVMQLENDLAGVTAAMEIEGIPIDINSWRSKIDGYKKKYQKSSDKLVSMAYDETNLDEQLGIFERGTKLNLGSPKQVADVLTRLGVELPKSPKGNYMTDERTLSTINHPFAVELLEYRGLAKIMDSYGESLLAHIHPFTNRLHPDFNQIGTETGRYSCKDPNVQQIPADFRECVTLDDYVIVGADYANIELRIIAEKSGDPSLIAAFNTGDDPHKSTAAIMFNIPLDQVTKDQRFIAKTINFGLTYGMGAPKLRDMLNKDREQKLSINKIYSIINQYQNTYRGVTDWFREAGSLAYRQGYCETLLGRRRYFTRPSGVDEDTFKKQTEAIKRQGGNAPIQGSSADMFKLAMVGLYDQLRLYNYRAEIIIPLHDEIVILAHKRHAEAVKLVLEECMMEAAQEILKTVPVKVEAYISDKWIKG